MPTTGERFERVVSIMARLRAPGGCPWDREQTFDTIKPYTLEETYEVIEAIDARDFDELPGELGDLLLQVLFYSQMAAEEQHFSIDDVLERLADKLVGRHPHVFGDVKAETSGEVVRNWQALKAEGKEEAGAGVESNGPTKEVHPESVLAGISSAMPALMEAHKISSRVANVGFDWPNIEGLFDKLNEETQELRKNLEEYPEPGPQPESAAGVAGARGVKVPEELRARLEDEVGDLLFVLVNIARYLSLDPESALRKTNRKFRRRFEYLEARLREQGRKPGMHSLAEMESLMAGIKATGKSMSVDALLLGVTVATLEEFSACRRVAARGVGLQRLGTGAIAGFFRRLKDWWSGHRRLGRRHLVRLCLVIPGAAAAHPYLHSHMLGVKEGYRNTGLGRRIKLFQREDAIARGYELIEWTFDPMEIKNAYFNLERLGAIARRYNINQYGITTSPLQGFLPTDRLVAEWWMRSNAWKPCCRRAICRDFKQKSQIAVPDEDLCLESRRRNSVPKRAAEVQSRNRELFLDAFAKGLACLGYGRDDHGAASSCWDAGTKIGRTERPDGSFPMKIEAITLRELQIPLVHFFETSFGRTYTRRVMLVTLHSDGLEGWGECVAGEHPYYSEEYIEGAWDVIVRYLAPSLLGKHCSRARGSGAAGRVRQHRMAKAALENAVWDAEAQEKGIPLWQLLGGTRGEIACGVSIGIQDSHEQLLQKIETELAAGYQRIKVKVKPGWDVNVLAKIRARWPEILLSCDANSAYTLE